MPVLRHFKCNHCDEKFTNKSDLVEFNDKLWCSDCLERNGIEKCEDCGEYHDETYHIDDKDKRVCEDCSNNYSFCNDCDTYNEEMTEITIGWRETKHVCDHCAENSDKYTKCDCCSETVLSEDVRNTDEYGHGDDLCDDCFNDSYSYCCDCSTIVHHDNASFTDNGTYCENCHCGSEHVHNYNYTPILKFNGKLSKLPFMGLELEFECRRNLPEIAEKLHDDYINDDFYLKEDSSLDNGIELVSMPTTLDHWQGEEFSDNFSKMLQSIKNRGGEADSSCGIHVHIDRRWMNIAHIEKFEQFFGLNKENLQLLAGRKNNMYCNFRNKKSLEKLDSNKALLNFNAFTGSRGAVNWANNDTVEIRIFASTLNSNSVQAKLELCEAVFMFTKQAHKKAIRSKSRWNIFINFVKKNADRYSNLLNLITENKLDMVA